MFLIYIGRVGILKKVIIVFLVLLLLIGCSKNVSNQKDKEILNYDRYLEFVNKIYKDFAPEEYQLISHSEGITRLITTLPESNIDKRKTDAYQDDYSMPTRNEVYYINPEKNIGIKLNIIYKPELVLSEIVYLNTISPVDNVSIAEDFKTINRPTFSEITLAYKGLLFNVNYWSTNKEVLTNDEVTQFLIEGSNFYKKLENFIINTLDNGQ